MGLLDWVLGRRDPSAEWAADPGRTLELDLEASSLGGVPLGEAVDRLGFLGPPENPWPSRAEDYRWHARGIQAQTTDGRLDTFIFFWPRGVDLPRPFGAPIFWRGKPLGWTAATRREEVERLFGPPYRADDTDDEPVLYYEHGDVEWQIEFAADGGLMEWMLVKPGLYSDPAWRAQDGITRPFPPPRGEGAPL